MKHPILLPLLFVWVLFGCDVPEDPSSEDLSSKEMAQLQEVLSGPFYTPSGKLKTKRFFQQGPENLRYQTDYYYDNLGRELLAIQLVNQDTVKISIYHYLPNGLLDKTSIYGQENGKNFFQFQIQRSYSDNGKTIEVIPLLNNSNSLFELFKYDDLGRLTRYKRGKDPYSDINDYLYDSDESQKISFENYSQYGMDEPFYRYRYFYDTSGNLQSKSIQTSDTEYYPVYEYSYNSANQLVEEWLNDIYFWSGPTERTTYEYY